MSRKKQLGMIHMLKKKAGLDDETYRAMLKTHGGHDSSAKMDEAQRNQVISWLNASLDSGSALLKTKADALKKLHDLLDEQSKSKNYAHEIARRMFERPYGKCNLEELKQVINVLARQGRREK